MRGVSFIKFQVYYSYFFSLQYQKVKLLRILSSNIFTSNTLFFISMDFCLPRVFRFHPSSIDIFPPSKAWSIFSVLVCQSLISTQKICLPSLITHRPRHFFLSFFSFFIPRWELGFTLLNALCLFGRLVWFRNSFNERVWPAVKQLSGLCVTLIL